MEKFKLEKWQKVGIALCGAGLLCSLLFFIPFVQNLALDFGENFLVHRPLTRAVWIERFVKWGMDLCGVCFVSAIIVLFGNYLGINKIKGIRNEIKEISTENKNQEIKPIVIFAFIFFIFMMLFNLMHSSLWGDEWVEYDISQKDISNMVGAIRGTFQPPLYNFIMHFWLKAGNDILWFRLFNVLLGTISGIFLYKTVKFLTSEKVAIGTVFTLSITYQWIYCIQECSEYSLMLMFIFMTLYFFVKAIHTKKLLYEIGFVLGCVGAMYSQYGAFFVVFPSLMIYAAIKFFRKDKREFIFTITTYIIFLFLFAMPLYFRFARFQIGNNKISQNTNLNLTFEAIKNFPLVFGKLIAYFINVKNNKICCGILVLFGLCFICLAIFILTRKFIDCSKKVLIAVLVSAYILFYWLVEFHIYAMVHPNVSSGFFSRYAYFFIPLFFTCVPVCFNEILLLLPKTKRRFFLVPIKLISLLVYLIGLPSVLRNWNKAYDKEFAEIWYVNAGFKETTYLTTTTAGYGFDYYTKKYNFEKDKNKIVYCKNIDINNLDDSFWVWRSNWLYKGELWSEILKKAKESKYEINIFFNSGYSGQLAYCKKMDEKAIEQAKKKAEKAFDIASEPLHTARFDIKVENPELPESNIKFEILNPSDKANFHTPQWFGKNGVGYVFESSDSTAQIKVTCLNDGKFLLWLRGKDIRKNGKRLPIFVKYESLKINGENILSEAKSFSHDKPFKYELDVKKGDVLNVEVVWSEHDYATKEERDAMIKQLLEKD